MTTDDLVEYACALDGDQWRALAARMSWYHRSCRSIPKELAKLEEIVADKGQWCEIKRLISKRRRSAYRSSKRREQLDRRDRRRTYMREYMRNYRSK